MYSSFIEGAVKLSLVPSLRGPAKTYLIFLAALVAAGSFVPNHLRKPWFLENGIIEDFQLCHLTLGALVSACLFFLALSKRLPEQAGSALILFCFLWASNRELDGFWEPGGRHSDTFDAIRFLLSICIGAVALLRFRSCYEMLKKWGNRQSFLAFYYGVAGYLIAQLLSAAIYDLGSSRLFKRSFEESIELLAGAFLLIGALELYAAVRAETKLATSAPSMHPSQRATMRGTSAETSSEAADQVGCHAMGSGEVA